MAIIVAVMLLIVWAIVLGPGAWRRYHESRSSDSIHDFHRALRVLQRTGAPVVAPAHRLRVAGQSVVRGQSVDGRPPLLLVRPDTASPVPAAERRPARAQRDAYFRPEVCKRRRDILVGLVISVVGAGFLGALPPLRPMLAVMVIAIMALIGYLVLLVRLRTMAAQRRARQRTMAAYWAAVEESSASRWALEGEEDIVEARVAAR